MAKNRETRGGVGRQVLWFLLHLMTVYAITTFLTTRLAVWMRGTLLPLFQKPTHLSSSEFLFSHIFVFSFVPAVAIGLINVRLAILKHWGAQFVWLLPTVILAYKFVTFSAPSEFHSQFAAAVHQYFGAGFLIPEFQDWGDFWRNVRSNSDMMRGMAQLNFTAPFFAGVGYSAAAWTARRASLDVRFRK